MQILLCLDGFFSGKKFFRGFCDAGEQEERDKHFDDCRASRQVVFVADDDACKGHGEAEQSAEEHDGPQARREACSNGGGENQKYEHENDADDYANSLFYSTKDIYVGDSSNDVGFGIDGLLLTASGTSILNSTFDDLGRTFENSAVLSLG